MQLQEKIQSLKKHYEKVLDDIGEDKNREGLLNTPERVAKSMVFLTAGYEMDPVAIINSAKFKEDYHDMVLIKDTEFYSMCEHHMLPFFGKVHVAYVPDGEIVGLSKIPRIIDVFARRLQVQERMTVQIRECIENTLHPKGVAVVVEAQHLCMQMRGVQKQGAVTRTMDVSVVFNEKAKLEEFLNAIS
jgi:GTP cyclohydrolase I